MPLSLFDGGVRAAAAAVAIIAALCSPAFLHLSDPDPIPLPHKLPPPPPPESAITVISVCAALLSVMVGWIWTVGLGGMVGAGLRREIVGGTERRLTTARRAEGGAASVPRQIMQVRN